jgi:hypothetical protein
MKSNLHKILLANHLFFFGWVALILTVAENLMYWLIMPVGMVWFALLFISTIAYLITVIINLFRKSKNDVNLPMSNLEVFLVVSSLVVLLPPFLLLARNLF